MGKSSHDLSVLVVDHRPAIAASIARELRPQPGIRLLASIPTASLSPAPAGADSPDVVVCGVGVLLPETTARLARLRSRWPHAFLIALSYDPNAESRDSALALGADTYVSGFSLRDDLRAALAGVHPRSSS